MNLYDLILEKMEGRVVGMMGLGGSLEQLEKRIEEFKDCNICWASLNNCDIIDTYILSKINEGIEIYFTFAPDTREADINIKMPLIQKVIDRDGIVISTKLRLQVYKERFNNKYIDKIIDILDVSKEKKDSKNRARFSGFLSRPKPISSMGTIIPFLSIFNPKKIILFGCDGCESDPTVKYFKQEIQFKRKNVYVTLHGIYGNVEEMNKILLETLKDAKEFFQLDKLPEIVNCSPNSQYSMFRKIDYDQLKEEINV